MAWAWREIQLGEPLVDTAPDFLVPATVAAAGKDARTSTGVRFDLRYDAVQGRFAVAEIAISRPEDEEVSSVVLRTLKVQMVLQDLLSAAAFVFLANGSPYSPEPASAPSGRAIGGVSGAELLAVARVYRHAEILNRRPKLAVERIFAMPPATASRWVRRARDSGLLGSS